ncbi:MAG: molybdenum cofactor guanylyltransferase [Deltaproteobacteria bacterium]|nr:molybdenum cofactor guanylyltransferase [Deltaproteobacteria bacterium]
MKKPACAGIILAGGRGTRLEGRNKALITVEGRTSLDRLADLLKSFFKPVIVVTNQPREYLLREEMIVTDLLDLRSSLTGIYSGLFHAPTSHAFVIGGDMPYLKKEMVELILENLEPGWDVVVPVTAAGYQPLAAIYSRRCLPVMARQLAQQRCKVSAFFSGVRMKKIPEARLRQVDPELISFFNINTPSDLEGLPAPAGS